jgi:hypothetical protein
MGASQRVPVAREFLLYLNERGHRDAAGSVARHLAGRAAAEDVPLLLGFLDDSLAEGRLQPSLEIWNALSDAGLIRQPHLNAAGTRSHSFETLPFARHGFDWRLESNLDAIVRPAGGELRVRLSGTGGDFAVLAWQYFPVTAGASCVFQFTTAEGTGGPAPAGIIPLLFSRSGTGRWEELPPRAPSPSGLLRAAICYRRPPGVPRVAVEAVIRDARVDCRP